MSLSPIVKRWLHWTGSGLALVGIAFVGLRLKSYWLELDFNQVTPFTYGMATALSLVYGIANLLLALAWWFLIAYQRQDISCLAAVKVYGVSQLAKYVPGNIFHLAGRQALGLAVGVSGAALAKSAIWELVVISLAGLSFGWIALPLIVPGFPLPTGVFLFSATVAVLAVFVKRLSLKLVWALGLYLFFLVISAAVFVGLLALLGDDVSVILHYAPLIASAYVIAWLAGLVTPGAPAGIGVRELVLLFLLGQLVPEGTVLMAVVLGRMVTVVGDLLFFVAAYAVPVKFSEVIKSRV